MKKQERADIGSLDEAVGAVLAVLDGQERAELVSLVLNSRTEPAGRWLREVIAMFGLSDSNQALVQDIENRFPDESALKLIESDGSEPVFEAKVILREAQRRIRQEVQRA